MNPDSFPGQGGRSRLSSVDVVAVSDEDWDAFLQAVAGQGRLLNGRVGVVRRRPENLRRELQTRAALAPLRFQALTASASPRQRWPQLAGELSVS